MAIGLKNEQEVERHLIGNNGPLVKALDYVMQKVSERNLEQIQKIVYDVYEPTVYQRTGEFKEAWNYAIQSSGASVTGEFKYDWETMHYNSSLGQHGTPDSLGPAVVSAYGDAREYLAEIIYNGIGRNSTHVFGHGPYSRKRDAWEPVFKTVESKIYMWFRQGCEKNGLVVR